MAKKISGKSLIELKERFLNTFKNYQKRTWIPVTKKGDTHLVASKFSGKPYLAKSESWPCCPDCKEFMKLFVQLNINDLPEEFRKEYDLKEGLLQVFYCTTFHNTANGVFECDFLNREPFSDCNLIRIIVPDNDPHDYQPPLIKENFSPKTITSWEEKTDMPQAELDDEIYELFSEEEEDMLYELDLNYSNDKLGGWPWWMGGRVKYPVCPDCNKAMRHVFQFGCKDNINYSFGDMGTGWVFQCKEHPQVLTFCWQCL